jgi:hypothetical protein
MADHSQQLARYLRLREAGKQVAHALVESLSKDVMDEGGETLGILKRGVLVFDSEEEMSLLMDFCIHDIRRGGQNAVERMLARAPYPAGSDQAIFLEALKDAHFSLFLVEGTEPGAGVHVRDLARDECFLLYDVGFSRTAQPDLLIAFRVIRPDNLPMTTGTAVPLGRPARRDREVAIRDGMTLARSFLNENRTPEERSTSTGRLLQTFLADGRMSQMAYEEPGGGPVLGPTGPAPASKPPPGVGRYDPCPCGSGKKYKFCCGARRR